MEIELFDSCCGDTVRHELGDQCLRKRIGFGHRGERYIHFCSEGIERKQRSLRFGEVD